MVRKATIRLAIGPLRDHRPAAQVVTLPVRTGCCFAKGEISGQPRDALKSRPSASQKPVPKPRPNGGRRSARVAAYVVPKLCPKAKHHLRLPALLLIHLDEMSPSRGSWRQDRWPTLGGDGFRRGTAGQNTRCEVSTIRAANSSSNREGDPHTGSHLVPVPVAEMADDGQLRAVCRQHVRPEIRLGAKTGKLPVH